MMKKKKEEEENFVARIEVLWVAGPARRQWLIAPVSRERRTGAAVLCAWTLVLPSAPSAGLLRLCPLWLLRASSRIF